MTVHRWTCFHGLLLCWATASASLALAAIETWGFAWEGLMWRKTGKVRLGTGCRVRSTGDLIVATLGNRAVRSSHHLRRPRAPALATQ